MATNQSRIKKAVEKKIVNLLNGSTAKKEDLQIISLGIKYLSVAAKLEENEYGKDLDALVEEDDELDPDAKIEQPE